MKLSDLIRELAALEARGYGDRLVIDNNGNDVAEVHPPEPRPAECDPDSDSELDAVLLTCFVDYDLRRQS